jgi:hypothetical protein
MRRLLDIEKLAREMVGSLHVDATGYRVRVDAVRPLLVALGMERPAQVPQERAGVISREPIPAGVYWNKYHNCFYGSNPVARLSDEFTHKWHERRDEFPQSHWDVTKATAPIPENVYWSNDGGNFYHSITGAGMGNDFYLIWIDRKKEFPQSREAAQERSGVIPL